MTFPTRVSAPSRIVSPAVDKGLRHSASRAGGWLALVAMVVAGWSPAVGRAEERAPAAVLTIASIDRVLIDVDALLAAGGVPEYGQIVRGFIAGLNDLRGIDRTRPLGGMLFIDPANASAEPDALIFLPVSDIDELRIVVNETGNSLEPTDQPGEFALRLGRDHLRLRLDGSYACIGRVGRPSPALSPGQLDALLADTSSADVVLTLHREGLPAAVIGQARQRLEIDLDRDRQQRPAEDQAIYELRAATIDAVFGLLDGLLQEAEGLRIAWELSDLTGAGSLAIELKLADGGEVAPWVHRTLVQPVQFRGLETPEAALRCDLAIELSPAAREIGESLLKIARHQAEKRVGNGVSAEVRQRAGQVFDALEATIARGRIEGLLAFLPTPSGQFVLLAALHMERASMIDDAARGTLPLATEAHGIRGVVMDAVGAGGLTFHRVVGGRLRARDARVYGEDAALYLAAGREAVWLALGGNETPPLLEDLLSSAPGETSAALPSGIELRLLPWTQIAVREAAGHERAFAELAQMVLEPTPGAAIRLGLEPTEAGLRLGLVIDPAYMQLLARTIVEAARER